MKTIRFSTVSFWLGFMTCLLGLNSLICAQEIPQIVYELDFDDCDPVNLKGAVMSVNPKNKTITVAEREIRLMDVGADDQRLKTALMNTDGKPEKIESFKVGAKTASLKEAVFATWWGTMNSSVRGVLHW